jgi:hypothetical protein
MKDLRCLRLNRDYPEDQCRIYLAACKAGEQELSKYCKICDHYEEMKKVEPEKNILVGCKRKGGPITQGQCNDYLINCRDVLKTQPHSSCKDCSHNDVDFSGLKQSKPEPVLCVKCKGEKKIAAKGLCWSCYEKQKTSSNKSPDIQPIKEQKKPDQTITDFLVKIEFKDQDIDLYNQIQKEAEFNRRSIENQILWMIDRYYKPETNHLGFFDINQKLLHIGEE